MSLYIHPDNQKILWETTHKIPGFQQIHSTNKEKWFKNIIQKFYENNKFKLLTKQDLQILNKETISYMIKQINDTQPVQPVSFSNSSNFSEAAFYPESTIQFSENTIDKKSATRDFILEQKQNEVTKQFSNRQKEYTDMKKNVPAFEIDFRAAAVEDTPIENMDALIKEHLKQRELEVKQYESKVYSPLVPEIDVVSLDTHREHITKRSDKFPFNDITDSPPSKNVHWPKQLEIKGPVQANPPQIASKFVDSTITREFMIEMKEYMIYIRSEIDDLKKMIQTNKTNTKETETNAIVSGAKLFEFEDITELITY
jgi:hypothetical protein